jgi:hypothetical protein
MVSAPQAGTVAARLLTAPHLFHPGWLLGAGPRTGLSDGGPTGSGRPGTRVLGAAQADTAQPETPQPGTAQPDTARSGTARPGTTATGDVPSDQKERAGPAERPNWAHTPRPGASQGPGTAATESPESAETTDSAERGRDMDAVPFAAATPIAPAVAGRLAAAVRAAGGHLVFACPVAAGRSAEVAAKIQADGAQIHAALQSLGTPAALAVLPDLSAALLTTEAGFAVAAGPRQFVEAVTGADVRRARAGFAEFALASAASSAQPLQAARYYGCALSGRPWRPFWLAWSSAADVPYGTGIGVQLSAMRQFVDGRLSAADFGRMFRAARRHEMREGERATGLLAAALDATCWALDGYVPPGAGSLRTPGQLDIDGLREAVSVALSDV